MKRIEKKAIGFWAAVSMGIGGMVGAGIFALLGEAGAIAGSAIYISFLLAGSIALLSGYSFGKLGAKYPSAGGIVEYLTQSFGTGIFTGTMSLVLYFAALVSLSLIAKAFGNYAALFFPSSGIPLEGLFSIFIILFFVIINLRGAKDVAIFEQITVGIKFLVLVILALSGLFLFHPEFLTPKTYPPVHNIFASLAITFFAFEGFRIITNTAEDMPNPEKTLPRAIMVSIALVAMLYLIVSISVFGNLSMDTILAGKDSVLAQAAQPIFGNFGKILVTVTALIATASAINANLYSVTNVTYKLAKDGELPSVFGKPIAHSREGLLVSGVLIIVLSIFFNLGEVAAIGSIAILFVHFITHIGHFKIRKKTGVHTGVLGASILTTFMAMVLAFSYEFQHSSIVATTLLGGFLAAMVIETSLQKFGKKTIRTRIPVHK